MSQLNLSMAVEKETAVVLCKGGTEHEADERKTKPRTDTTEVV
jgi:hypothetical protein